MFRQFCMYDKDYLDYLYINGIHPSFTFNHVEFHFVVFTDLVNQTGYMNKDIGLSVLGRNKPKSFEFIKKFNSSFLHSLAY